MSIKRIALLTLLVAFRRRVGLPFAIAERFAHQLQAAGLHVTWLPFDGGHEIPRSVIDALNSFLDEIAPRTSSATGAIRPTARPPGSAEAHH